jgi:hypothetical protein
MLREFVSRVAREAVRVELKKELRPIKEQLSELYKKVDRAIVVAKTTAYLVGGTAIIIKFWPQIKSTVLEPEKQPKAG